MKPKRTCRRYRTADEIKQLLAAYRRGNQSARRFALEHDISPGSFRNWLKGLVPRKAAGPRWVEVIPTIAPPSTAPAVTVEVGEGLKLQLPAGFVAAPVAELIRLLRQP